MPFLLVISPEKTLSFLMNTGAKGTKGKETEMIVHKEKKERDRDDRSSLQSCSQLSNAIWDSDRTMEEMVTGGSGGVVGRGVSGEGGGSCRWSICRWILKSTENVGNDVSFTWDMRDIEVKDLNPLNPTDLPLIVV